jgi:hypothetical protein
MKVDMLPARIKNFPFSGTGVKKQSNNLSHLQVAVPIKFREQAPHLLLIQITLPSPGILQKLDSNAGVA